MSLVRPATADDLPELIRLREVLIARMAEDFEPSASDNGWRDEYVKLLVEGLADDTIAVRVIDTEGPQADPSAPRLASCGIGIIDRRMPSPWNPGGQAGYVLAMATDPGLRRQGHGEQILVALLTWFRERHVSRVDLHATTDGEQLYRRLGFASQGIALTWRDRGQRH